VGASFAAFASGCLLGAGITLVLFLLADAVANKFPEEAKRSSALIRGVTSGLVLGLAWFSHIVALDKSSVMLLMLVVILLCAKVGGFVDVLGLSALATCLLVYYVLPPVQSWNVENPQDRIALTLFIGIALLAGQLMRRGKQGFSLDSTRASQE
jgi:K+-sensing histidine kinase KdpD